MYIKNEDIMKLTQKESSMYNTVEYRSILANCRMFGVKYDRFSYRKTQYHLNLYEYSEAQIQNREQLIL